MNLRDELRESTQQAKNSQLNDAASKVSPLARHVFKQVREQVRAAAAAGRNYYTYKSEYNNYVLREVATLFRAEGLKCRVHTDQIGLPSVCTPEYELTIEW